MQLTNSHPPLYPCARWAGVTKFACFCNGLVLRISRRITDMQRFLCVLGGVFATGRILPVILGFTLSSGSVCADDGEDKLSAARVPDGLPL